MNYVDRNKISSTDALEMHTLFLRYYENAPLDTFIKDLGKKDGALVLREKDSNRIVGFTTVHVMQMEHDGKTINGLFSGDTIIEKQYWGSATFRKGYANYIGKLKLKYIGRPLYWFLISKGYKTYLLMTNNFVKYYPRPESDDPQMKAIVEAYTDLMFPGYYNKKTKLLDFGDDYQKLKSITSPVTDDIVGKDKNIKFFIEQNPTWERGTELPCVAEISFTVYLMQLGKIVNKVYRAKPKMIGASIWRKFQENQ